MMYARMVAATGDTNLDYDSFVAALTAFGGGQMNSLNAAMRRAGLPGVPGNLNSVMAYAARQIATGNALRGADAASAAGQNAEGELEEAASVKYSIRQLSDGTKYVDVDTDQDIFEGAQEEDYGRIARQYIKDHFRNTVIGNDVKAYVTRDSENEYTSPANHGLSRNIYTNKMRAATELNNILDAGEYIGEFDDDGRHGPDKRHHSGAEKWIKYRVLFKVGDRFFEGITSLKKITRGYIFYDVTKIEDVSRLQLTDYAENAQHQTGNIPTDNIAENGGNVNDKLSLKADADYMAAVERGDMETARRMVDEAASLKFGLKSIEDLSEEKEREILQDTVNGAYDNGTYVPLRRNTPGILIEEVAKHTNGQIKLKDHPIISEVEHLRQTMDEASGSYDLSKRPHDISENEMIEIIKKMDDPTYIVLQDNGRYVEVVRYRGDDGDGHSAWAVVDFDAKPKNEEYLNGYPGGFYNF